MTAAERNSTNLSLPKTNRIGLREFHTYPMVLVIPPTTSTKLWILEAKELGWRHRSESWVRNCHLIVYCNLNRQLPGDVVTIQKSIWTGSRNESGHVSGVMSGSKSDFRPVSFCRWHESRLDPRVATKAYRGSERGRISPGAPFRATSEQTKRACLKGEGRD